ncbi:MAG: hypothetical protein GW798_12145 [Roseovarius sp.]|nr:hypothetical protein [Roseovarius sp.]
MRQVFLIAAGVFIGVGLALATDPRFEDVRSALPGILPEWISGASPVTSQ